VPHSTNMLTQKIEYKSARPWGFSQAVHSALQPRHHLQEACECVVHEASHLGVPPHQGPAPLNLSKHHGHRGQGLRAARHTIIFTRAAAQLSKYRSCRGRGPHTDWGQVVSAAWVSLMGLHAS